MKQLRLKSVTVVGTSKRSFKRKDGSTHEKVCVRYSNNLNERINMLENCGHFEINLFELGEPMSKLEAVQYLNDINFANGNKEIQDAIDQEIAKQKNADAVQTAMENVIRIKTFS